MNEIMVRFTENDTGRSVEFPAVSKYNIITGLSGIGKTWFFNYVLSADSEFVSRQCVLPIITATNENINAIFSERNLMDRTVVFVDELLLKQYDISEKLINKSKHILFCISRDIPFIGYVSVNGMFHVKRESGWFKVDRLVDLDQVVVSKSIKDYDFIVTESALGRSEHEFLKNWNSSNVEIISANGKDRVQKVLLGLNKKLHHPKILVLMDLSNFGMQYRLLVKRCRDNPNIVFYDYGSFEEMLFHSEFLHGCTNLDRFDFITLERFYEKALENYTKNMPLCYRHGRQLSPCYLSECSDCTNCRFICDEKFIKIVGSDSSLLKLVDSCAKMDKMLFWE